MLVAKDETEPQDMINILVAVRRRYVIEVNTDATKVVSISRQQSQIRNMIDQKQPKNVEYFNSLGTLITGDATCTCEIRSRIALAKAIFYKKTLFTSKLNLNFEK
jgi:hypothetical protein